MRKLKEIQKNPVLNSHLMEQVRGMQGQNMLIKLMSM